MPTAVVRVALPLHQPLLLELVQEPDQLAAVVAERVGDRAWVSREPSSSTSSTPKWYGWSPVSS